MQEEYVKKLAKKWYNLISFPKEFDGDFENLLNAENDLECMSFKDYDLEANKLNKGKNLIMFLYFCEELSERYKKLGIPEEILLATIDDFIISVKRQYNAEGKIGLVTTAFLENHLSMKLFRLGRLQFHMTESPMDVPEMDIKKGDNIIAIHIPQGGALLVEECEKSFDMAEEFFAKYFPDFDYKYYSCSSWLLADNLKLFLNENSNILKFQKFFKIVNNFESDTILIFMFKYDIESREELKDCPAESSFAKKVKNYALEGGKLYAGFGVKASPLKQLKK